MDFFPEPGARPQRATALAVTLAVHVVLLGLFYLSKPAQERVPEGRSMVFWFVQEKKPAPLRPAQPATAPPQVRQTRVVSEPRRVITPAAPQAITPAVADIPPPSPVPETVNAPAAASSPLPSAADIVNQARRDVGAIDRDMRRQIPKGLVRAPVSTPYKRFVKGVELASEMAPRAWYEAPKIREVINPGGNGARRYRVGKYCLSYYDNRNRAGNDPIGNGIAKPTIPTNCPPDEQPPTTQE